MKKRVGRAVVYTILALFIISFIFLISYGIYFLRNNVRYNITEIEVKNNTYYSAEEILQVANITLGENIFKISKNDIVSNITLLPYIKRVTISKDLPNKLILQIEERNTCYVAYAKDSSEYILLDEEGYILNKITNDEIGDKLLLFGINFDDEVKLGDKLTDIEKGKLLSLEKVYSLYMNSGIDKKVTSVTFRGTKITLTLNNEIDVIVANNNETEYKIRLLKTILNEVEGKTGKIDLTLDSPVFSLIVK